MGGEGGGGQKNTPVNPEMTWAVKGLTVVLKAFGTSSAKKVKFCHLFRRKKSKKIYKNKSIWSGKHL